MKEDELEEDSVYAILNVLEELNIDTLEWTNCNGPTFGPPDRGSPGDDSDDENDFAIGGLIYSKRNDESDLGCCKKLLACIGYGDIGVEEGDRQDTMADEIVILTDIRSQNTMVTEDSGEENDLPSNMDSLEMIVLSDESKVSVEEPQVTEEYNTDGENSHNWEDEDSGEENDLPSNMDSLEMIVLSDENKVIVEEPQVTGGYNTDSDSCSLGHGIKTLNFGRTYNSPVVELVRGNFKDDTVVVLDEESEEESEDSKSDYGMVVNHVEETIELDELESGVNDNDSGDYSECRGVVRVISGGLGT